MGTDEKSKQQITLEDYLQYYHIAYKRNNIKAMLELDKRFPELSKLSSDKDYMAKKANWEDEEWYYIHPIVMDSTRMSEMRVLDMVAYLYCQNEAPSQFTNILKEKILYRTIFNYDTDRYQRDYNREALWIYFFNGVPELCQRIKQRRIKSLSELEYRATEYFENGPSHRARKKFFYL